MKTSKIILALFIVQIFCLFVPEAIFCQTETVDIIKFTPPKGWTKTPKEGVIIYSDSDKNTGGFCLLSVYPSTTSTGSPEKDFANEWKELIVKPFKAEANPKTETQTEDGWTSVSSATQIESDGNKSAVMMTVISGYGRTASIFAILNNQQYLPQIEAFMAGIKMDKAQAIADAKPPVQNHQNSTIQKDPFPDKPGFQPQKPLLGTLKETITMVDLAGQWSEGGGIVTSYVNSSSGDYAGTETTIALKYFTIKSDGTFEASFLGRASNHTVREKSAGTVTLSDGYIILKTTSGEGKDTMVKYQFISYMVMPNGGAVVTVIRVGYDLNAQGYTPEQLAYACGHANGVITCGPSGENWVLRTVNSTK